MAWLRGIDTSPDSNSLVTLSVISSWVLASAAVRLSTSLAEASSSAAWPNCDVEADAEAFPLCFAGMLLRALPKPGYTAIRYSRTYVTRCYVPKD